MREPVQVKLRGEEPRETARAGTKRATRPNAWMVGLAVSAGFGAVAVTSPLLTTQLLAKTDSANVPVTAVIRNDLGQLKWVATEASNYSPLEAEGRQIYLRSGCTYCHSQFFRPMKSETRPWGTISADARRWGPVPEPGEYAYDHPPSFGTKGIAPDLSRTGLKYSNEWHLAHFWRPPGVTPGSIMGGFSGLFEAPVEGVKIVDDDAGEKTLERSPETEKFFNFDGTEQAKLTPNADGVLFVPKSARDMRPLILIPNGEYEGETVTLVPESKDIAALTAYIQKLGMNRGMWRELYDSGPVDGADLAMPRSEEMIARGKAVYEGNCVGCHGVKGDGNGWAATFTSVQRPRDFTFGVFKFRSSKDPLPSDADLLRTITRGVRGTRCLPGSNCRCRIGSPSFSI